jgi:hypothetical protein
MSQEAKKDLSASPFWKKILDYSSWFRKGDTGEDIKEAIKDHGQPIKIFVEKYMACLVYKDKVIVTGYDGKEYTHEFEFTEVLS